MYLINHPKLYAVVVVVVVVVIEGEKEEEEEVVVVEALIVVEAVVVVRVVLSKPIYAQLLSATLILGIKGKFTKYLKESCCLASLSHFVPRKRFF